MLGRKGSIASQFRAGPLFSSSRFSAVLQLLGVLRPTQFPSLVQFLLVCRGLVGFGLGGVPVAFGLFLEFVPSSQRGQHSVVLQSAWTIGALVEAGLAWALMPSGGWRLLLAVSTIPLGKHKTCCLY